MENKSTLGYMNTPRYKLYEKFKSFIDRNPNRVWGNGLRAVGRTIDDKGVIIVYFEYPEGATQPTLKYEDFIYNNELTESDFI